MNRMSRIKHASGLDIVEEVKPLTSYKVPIEKYGGSIDNAIASYGLYYDQSLAKQNINPYVYRPHKHEYVFNNKDKKWYHNPVASLTFVEVDEDDVPHSNFQMIYR